MQVQMGNSVAFSICLSLSNSISSIEIGVDILLMRALILL